MSFSSSLSSVEQLENSASTSVINALIHFVNDELKPEIKYECKISLLTVTATNESWIPLKLRVRPYDFVIFKSSNDAEILLFTISFSQMIGVMLHPDKYEIRIETKPSITSFSGWFVLRCMCGEDYEFIADWLQSRSSEQYKQIVFEYKTKAQDKRYGLIVSDKLVSKIEKPRLIHKPYKQGQLTFKIYV